MKQWCLAVVLSVLASWAWADNGLSVENAWVRMVPPVSANSAAYFTLHNMGKTAAELVGVEGDVAKAIELHTVIQEGDMMRMQPLKKLDVPAGDCVLFKPGSNHVMLIGLKQPLTEGQQVPMTLRFSNGESLTFELTVKNDAGDDHAHHQH